MNTLQPKLETHGATADISTPLNSQSDNIISEAPTATQHLTSHISISAPFQWVQQGISDFRRIPGLSFLYGLIFVGLCAGTFLMIYNVPWYSLGYLTGLLMVGPFLAAGLYVASRDLELGVAPSVMRSIRLLNQRKTYLALFALMLALVMAAWIRFSALLFALTFTTLSPSVVSYSSLLASADGWIALSFFIGIGLLLATIVFITSAVAIPLILDKDVDFITAIQTSYRAVTRNPLAMAVWAAMIVAMTAVGIATAFVGLTVIFPILGYATWHSYRALLK